MVLPKDIHTPDPVVSGPFGSSGVSASSITIRDNETIIIKDFNFDAGLQGTLPWDTFFYLFIYINILSIES